MRIYKYTPFLTKQELELPFYMATIGNPKFQPEVLRPDGIPHYQLLYTVAGSGRCRISNSDVQVGAGDILFLPPYHKHEYHPLGNVWETQYITFGGSGFHDFFNHKATVCRLGTPSFGEWYARLQTLKTDNRYTELSVTLYQMLVSLHRMLSAVPQGKAHDNITAALKMINTNPDVSPTDIAEALHISTAHFCRIFKEYMGMRPTEYINMLKLQKAKDLLCDTRLSVAEVAAAVGFHDHSYFTKLFHRAFGTAPSAYRS